MDVIRNDSWFSRLRRSRTLVIIVVFVALMLDVMSTTSVDPIVPSMLKDLQNEKMVLRLNTSQIEMEGSAVRLNTSHTEMEGSALRLNSTRTSRHMERGAAIGAIVAAKPATEVVSNILVGYVVERYGHKFPMLLGLVFNFAATLGFAYSPTFTWLILTRVAQAIGSSLSVVAGLAMLAVTFPDDKERSKATGKAFGGISLGIILGYPFGSIVYQFLGRRAPFLILAGLTLFDGVLRLLVVSPRADSPISKIVESGYKEYLMDHYILVGIGFVFLQHFGLGIFLGTCPAWMLDVLHAQQWNIGVVLSIAVLFHLISQFVAGYLAPKYGRWKFSWVGLTLFGIGLAIYPLCRNIWEVLGPESLVRLGHGTVICVISPLMAHLADVRHNSEYGVVYGLYTATYNLGMSSGSLIGGVLIRYVSFSSLYLFTGIALVLYSNTSIVFRNPRPNKGHNKLGPALIHSDYGSFSSSIE